MLPSLTTVAARFLPWLRDAVRLELPLTFLPGRRAHTAKEDNGNNRCDQSDGGADHGSQNEPRHECLTRRSEQFDANLIR